MENSRNIPGSRQVNLKKSFNRGLRCLLTACSGEELRKAFPSFTAAEQERLHRLFTQVISSLHEDIEEEFEAIVHETQAGTILDNVDELVEEQSLDPLHSKKSNVGETEQNVSKAKKNELNYLMGLLEEAEERNRKMKERIELLRKEKHVYSGAEKLVHELRTRNMNYEKAAELSLLTSDCSIHFRR